MTGWKTVPPPVPITPRHPGKNQIIFDWLEYLSLQNLQGTPTKRLHGFPTTPMIPPKHRKHPTDKGSRKWKAKGLLLYPPPPSQSSQKDSKRTQKQGPNTSFEINDPITSTDRRTFSPSLSFSEKFPPHLYPLRSKETLLKLIVSVKSLLNASNIRCFASISLPFSLGTVCYALWIGCLKNAYQHFFRNPGPDATTCTIFFKIWSQKPNDP